MSSNANTVAFANPPFLGHPASWSWSWSWDWQKVFIYVLTMNLGGPSIPIHHCLLTSIFSEMIIYFDITIWCLWWYCGLFAGYHLSASVARKRSPRNQSKASVVVSIYLYISFSFVLGEVFKTPIVLTTSKFLNRIICCQAQFKLASSVPVQLRTEISLITG